MSEPIVWGATTATLSQDTIEAVALQLNEKHEELTATPLNEVYEENNTQTTKDWDLVINLPGQGGANQPTPSQLEAMEAAKRKRMLYIGGGVLAALILLVIVFALKK